MNQDINLFYFGASGGFFCLHLLLLTDQYSCVFCKHGQDFETVFRKQWDISNISDWKSHECWPNNKKTQTSTLTNKIYLTCNEINDFISYPGIPIILYTDIETQWYLAETKRAFWFFGKTNEELLKEIHKNFEAYYQAIKADDRADDGTRCKDKQSFNFLPDHIEKEFIKWGDNKCWSPNDLSIDQSFWFYKHGISLEYKNEKVFNKLIKNVNLIGNGNREKRNIVIKLQDLIKTKGTVLFDQLGIKGNQKTNDFVDFWLSKHTPEQLKYLIN